MGVPAPHTGTLATADLIGFLQDKGLAVADTALWAGAADTRFAPPEAPRAPAPAAPSTAPSVAPSAGAAGAGAVELFPTPAPAQGSVAAPQTAAPSAAPAQGVGAGGGEMPGGMRFGNNPLGPAV